MKAQNLGTRFAFSALVVLASMALATCDNFFQVGLGDEVDIEAPRIEITSRTVAGRSTAPDYVNTDIIVSGTVRDDRSDVTVSLQWEDSSMDGTVDGEEWSATIPIGEVTSDGVLQITAIATDASGKESAPATTSIQVDRRAPVVLVSSPQIYNPGPTNADYIVIQGESWDPSPITSVIVEVIDPADSSVLISQEAEGDRSWFTRILFTPEFVNGKEYHYRVLVTDAALNTNAYHYHASHVWDVLPSGALFPSMVELGTWDQEGEDIADIDAAGETALAASRIPSTASGTTLDFVQDSNKDRPQISLSNLDPTLPVTQNAIGERVPIFATAIDDKDFIDQSSVKLTITDLDPDDP
ncbi:MAG: hypothetical protein ACOC0O_06715, partial [Spirochaetota bacterium]